jgi:transglutaminase-like putative cysteine protease
MSTKVTRSAPGMPDREWWDQPADDDRRRARSAEARHELIAPGSPWRAVAVPTAVALGAVGAIASSRAHLPLFLGGAAGAAAALLGVFALPSLPTRRVVVVLLGLGGLGALRHASYTGDDTSALLVVWAVATLIALLLVDRAVTERVPTLVPGAPLERRGREIARTAVSIAVIASVAVVAFGPTITDRLGRHVWPGLEPSLGGLIDGPSSLHATGRLDMTKRPRLSDRVVFTVDAPRPSFWRGQTFDTWDGHDWTQSDPNTLPLAPHGRELAITPDPDDTGAFTGRAMRQTFRLESGYSDVVFAAPSPVEIETDKVVEVHTDGTATVYGGFGKGATYTVTSRSFPATAARLRAADRKPVPASVRTRFASPALTTDEVNSLARQITATAPTTYDKIRAIEAWLGAHVKYSLNAPLSPQGVDVVDDFLFRTRVGWCEQVASSLVVMARSVGIPARLATGFVSGHRDALSGQFVVRERDAHAWAEIYFAGVGWQPFDPTASVPLAGDAPLGGSWLDVARHHALVLGAIAAALVLLVAGFPEVLAFFRRRRARRRTAWSTRTMARLERLGRRAGRARRPAETPREYANALAVHLHDERIEAVGETLDADGFSGAGASPSARASADAVLSSLRP